MSSQKESFGFGFYCGFFLTMAGMSLWTYFFSIQSLAFVVLAVVFFIITLLTAWTHEKALSKRRNIHEL